MDTNELVGAINNILDQIHKTIMKFNCSRFMVRDRAIKMNPRNITIPRKDALKGSHEKDKKFKIKIIVIICL